MSFWDSWQKKARSAFEKVGRWNVRRQKPKERVVVFRVGEGVGMGAKEKAVAQAKIKRLTRPIGYKSREVSKAEKQKELFRKGQKLEEMFRPTKAMARGAFKGMTLGAWFPETLKADTKAEKEKYKYWEAVPEFATWMLPFGGVSKGLGLVGKLALKAKPISKMARIGAKIPMAGKMVKGAAPFAAISALEKPEEGKTRGEAAREGAGLGAMFPMLGGGLKIIRGIGKIPKELKPFKEAMESGKGISSTLNETLKQNPKLKKIFEKEVKKGNFIKIKQYPFFEGTYKLAPKVATKEARKYKSAEEFVEAQPKVYHGTSLENATRIREDGFKVGIGKGISGQVSDDFIFATTNKTSALSYVKDRIGIKTPTTIGGSFTGKTLEIPKKVWDFEAFAEAQKKLGIKLLPNKKGELTMLDIQGLKQAMKEQGYGAIQFLDRGADGKKALAIIPDKIKTKFN